MLKDGAFWKTEKSELKYFKNIEIDIDKQLWK